MSPDDREVRIQSSQFLHFLGVRKWHRHYGIQKLDRGYVEGGVPVAGRVKVRREAVAMVYVCELTNLPFLVVLPRVK